MTQDQIDALIADFQGKLAAATENLLALDDTLAMKRVEGRGVTVQPLTGVTAARVLPALKTMRDLFGQVGTLSEVVERAIRVRRSLNRLWRYSETLAEIEHLLTGESIPLPEVITPLAERNLLSSSAQTRATTPERLLTAMTDAFATARNAVVSLEAAWERGERVVNALLLKESSIREEVAALGLPHPSGIAEAQGQIAAFQRQVASDPLGINDVQERDLTKLLVANQAALAQSRMQRESVTANLLRARRLLGQIAEQETMVARSFAACQAALHSPGMRSAGDVSQRCRLEEWLRSLESSALEKRWPAVEIGLAHWSEVAQAAQTALVDAENTNQGLLELPAELRGRLTVLLARLQKREVPDETLRRLCLQAKELLDESCPSVDRAARLIEACEARLRDDNKRTGTK